MAQRSLTLRSRELGEGGTVKTIETSVMQNGNVIVAFVRSGLRIGSISLLWRVVRAAGLLYLLAGLALPYAAEAEELKFPQIITIHYEAKNPQTGGQFIIWVEREKIFYGLDTRFNADTKVFPGAKSVDITHVTPAPGTVTLTMITVTSVNSAVPDYFHLSGNVRLKISGMTITSSNMPSSP